LIINLCASFGIALTILALVQ